MNDRTKTSTTSGRPRVYESNSAKLDAFRSRLEGAGYLRKEVLVTRTTAEAVSLLAKAHGVGFTDAASALLEVGLAQFTQTYSAPAEAGSAPVESAMTPKSLHFEASAAASPAMSASATRSFQAAAPGPTARSRVEVQASRSTGNASSQAVDSDSTREVADEDNPILRFFANRRQESQK